MPEPPPGSQYPPPLDPTRGYAAWLISRGLDANLHTWRQWLRWCHDRAGS